MPAPEWLSAELQLSLAPSHLALPKASSELPWVSWATGRSQGKCEGEETDEGLGTG